MVANSRNIHTPDTAGVGYLLGAVVGSTAIACIAFRRLAKILQFVIGGAWNAINQDGRLELNNSVLLLTKVFQYHLIKCRLADAARIGVRVEPIVAHIILAGVVGVL